MTTKESTAGISTLANVVLTLLKFIAFFLTGSLAILAEAWHSFSDIVTSVLVFFSVREKPLPLLKRRGKKWGLAIPLEYVISFSIGLLMLCVSVALMYKAATGQAVVIKSPLVTGIIFIIFAISSYAVYRFETSVGKRENSVGLIADGMHSKSDMINSLLIGFSLIFYKMGFNVDAVIAFIIALFIFSYSIEAIINAVVAYQRRQKEYAFEYKSITLVSLLFEEQTWARLKRHFMELTSSKDFMPPLLRGIMSGFGKAVRYCLAVLVLILVFLYASTCVYKIGPSQEGILERFGSSLSHGRPIQPGIGFKFPWPIDKIVKIDSRIVRTRNIGNITDKGSFALLWTKGHGAETVFISGDNNFFYPYLVVHYRIKDIFKYRYNHIDSDTLLDSVTLRVISNIFARKEFYQLVTSYRKQFELDVARITQEKLDTLDSGLEIININMKDAHPPIFIASSFEEVIAAYQEKEELINQALGYRNESIPQARGRSQRIIREAEGYVASKKARSEGETSRFVMQLAEYEKSKRIIRDMLYFDFIKEAFSENRKIIVDPESGFPEIFMDFGRAIKPYQY